jgi:hypothetical protein
MVKKITFVTEMTFYKGDPIEEANMENNWEDMLSSPDNTIYLVSEEDEDPQKFGHIYYSLNEAKVAAGWE